MRTIAGQGGKAADNSFRWPREGFVDRIGLGVVDAIDPGFHYAGTDVSDCWNNTGLHCKQSVVDQASSAVAG